MEKHWSLDQTGVCTCNKTYIHAAKAKHLMTDLISKRTKPLLMIFLATLVLFTLSDSEKSQSQVEQLLLPLIGCWEGEALKTPRGALPYPVCFKRLDDGTLYGLAKLNVSDHHWYFYLNNKKSRLRFMSTFADNLKPVNLPATKLQARHIEFSTAPFSNEHASQLHIAIDKVHKGYLFTMTLQGVEHVIIRLAEKIPMKGSTTKTREAQN
ncbi:hypothetical protein [Photobacterium sp. J15]|uniref:hypothetical protein n=1 Tax=Photobacterium sp. J15 TaxID=265901 RepID=UPI0007E46C1E|nr:hypothetical protein [Photobacterium sp. J15]